MAGSLGFGKYIAAAFKNRWNLLILGGAVVAALISGHADIALPLIAAAEIGYLGFLGTHPRFQYMLEANNTALLAAESETEMKARFVRLYEGLDQLSRTKFDELRTRCLVFASISQSNQAQNDRAVYDGIVDAQRAGANKLLWVYIKLLHTKMALERFFWQIDANEIDRLERESRELLDRLQTTEVGGAMAEKKRRSIEDLLATVNARRANIAKARENYEFVSIELQRIEAKLSGIAELAVNRQNPDMLSHDVDEVARSVEATEEAIGELHSLTGLALSDDIMTPEILMPSLSNSRAR